MEILKWREQYQTGIKEMDEQHRQLIDLVNRMYTIMRDRNGYDNLAAILKEMQQYGDRHFEAEEQLLAEHEYPELETQKNAHTAYRQKIKTLIDGLGENDPESAKSIYLYLREWWVEHIAGEDREYGAYLRERGVD